MGLRAASASRRALARAIVAVVAVCALLPGRAAALPALSIDPASAPAGGSVLVRGSDHPIACAAEGLSRIDITSSDGATLAVVPALGLDGAFEVVVTVPAGARSGPFAVQSRCVIVQASAFAPEPALAAATIDVRSPASTPRTPAVPTGKKVADAEAVGSEVRGAVYERDPRAATARMGGPGNASRASRDRDRPAAGSTRSGDDVPPSTTAAEAGPDSPAVEVVRSVLPASLRRPSETGFDVAGLAATLVLAFLLMLLLGFPAELFNSTLEENYDEVRGWFRWIDRAASPLGKISSAMPSAARFGVFTLAAGAVYSFLDPNLGWNRGSLALAVGIVASLAISTAALEVPALLYARKRGVHGGIQSFAHGGIIAIACVLASRLLQFRPGYVYGITAGFQPEDGAMSRRDEGRATALGVAALLVISVAAWIGWGPVDELSARPNASLLLLIVDSTLAMTVVGGIQGVVFALLPLRFTDGATIKRWSAPAWAVLFFSSLVGFVYVLMTPAAATAEDAEQVSLWRAAALFVAFAAVSVGFWAYFRFRSPRALPDDDPSPEDSAQERVLARAG